MGRIAQRRVQDFAKRVNGSWATCVLVNLGRGQPAADDVGAWVTPARRRASTAAHVNRPRDKPRQTSPFPTRSRNC